MENKQILKEYENMNFGINSNIEDIEIEQHTYEAVLDYFEGNINFGEFILRIDGDCPPNSCFWCNYDCEKCDLESEIEDIMIRGGDCFECWRRCLEQEATEEPKINFTNILESFLNLCEKYEESIECSECEYSNGENGTGTKSCDVTNCLCVNEKKEPCPYSHINVYGYGQVECFVKYLQDNYHIEIKPKENDANV